MVVVANFVHVKKSFEVSFISTYLQTSAGFRFITYGFISYSLDVWIGSWLFVRWEMLLTATFCYKCIFHKFRQA